ncbi:HrgA protein [Jeongeupia wiesaeckerbachi]|uniref:HrgA protein n=1 Tax=Jeongeupia wiesaeckerbachi TaxID=3051218 RepID=UPI003D805266
MNAPIKMTLKARVVATLSAATGQAFTSAEMARALMAAYPEFCQQKLGASKTLQTDADLFWQLQAEIGGSLTDWASQLPALRILEGRPRKMCWAGEDVADPSVAVTAPASARPGLLEKDLYPVLQQWLWSEHKLLSMRINESTSSKAALAGSNIWLHPDLVALEDLTRQWQPELRACVRERGDTQSRLWSFEVKLALGRSNVRQDFFQTVSNSSWASFAYLVAKDIDSDALRELRLLCAAHGVGVIQLDPDDVSNSQIVIPARERAAVDWDMCNRLATINPDFVGYIKRVRKFYQTGEATPHEWQMPVLTASDIQN